jgi:hypothetical protein
MYVPATPAQPAVALAPVGIVSTTPALIARSASTALSVRHSELNVLDGHSVIVTGTLTAGAHPPEDWGAHSRDSRVGGVLTLRSMGMAGRAVMLQELGSHGWRTIADTHTGARGHFRLRYTPHRIFSERVRLRFAGDAHDLVAHRKLGWLNVYRLAEASWYGGGGNMACGGSLTSATLGVANKTLPCGTLVTLRYNGRSVRVPVVDRGPYVAGREFDLTEATKQALGFGDTGEVWSTR